METSRRLAALLLLVNLVIESKSKGIQSATLILLKDLDVPINEVKDKIINAAEKEALRALRTSGQVIMLQTGGNARSKKSPVISKENTLSRQDKKAKSLSNVQTRKKRERGSTAAEHDPKEHPETVQNQDQDQKFDPSQVQRRTIPMKPTEAPNVPQEFEPKKTRRKVPRRNSGRGQGTTAITATNVESTPGVINLETSTTIPQNNSRRRRRKKPRGEAIPPTNATSPETQKISATRASETIQPSTTTINSAFRWRHSKIRDPRTEGNVQQDPTTSPQPRQIWTTQTWAAPQRTSTTEESINSENSIHLQEETPKPYEEILEKKKSREGFAPFDPTSSPEPFRPAKGPGRTRHPKNLIPQQDKTSKPIEDVLEKKKSIEDFMPFGSASSPEPFRSSKDPTGTKEEMRPDEEEEPHQLDHTTPREFQTKRKKLLKQKISDIPSPIHPDYEVPTQSIGYPTSSNPPSRYKKVKIPRKVPTTIPDYGPENEDSPTDAIPEQSGEFITSNDPPLSINRRHFGDSSSEEEDDGLKKFSPVSRPRPFRVTADNPKDPQSLDSREVQQEEQESPAKLDEQNSDLEVNSGPHDVATSATAFQHVDNGRRRDKNSKGPDDYDHDDVVGALETVENAKVQEVEAEAQGTVQDLKHEESNKEDKHDDDEDHHHAVEKGVEQEHDEEHHEASGENGDKGYETWHEHDKAEKGHHDKDDHVRHYSEDHGEEKKHDDEGGYHAEHHFGEEAEKDAEYGEKGEHQKGHSTKGKHTIHKKDEYEKKTEFFDEFNEDGGMAKDGEFHHEHEEQKGGHKKTGHHDSGHHEEDHGKGEKHEEGHHRDEHVGHKKAVGQQKHHKHGEKHGEKGDHQEGHKWAYKKSEGGDDQKKGKGRK
ncbi:proteoglycan 4 [Orussus abietinus]|uniref:proteoglycan 4 n=1 Tax=Orussus abietinus TaxID=222816 RepID=UPI0006254D9F|nr:proteoglycan 4 [Orussus abietinus]